MGLMLAGFLAGCSTPQVREESGTTPREIPALGSTKPTGIRLSDTGDLLVNGVKLEVTEYDFPITINSRVEFWVDYFTGRGRKHFEKYLERSELFIPFIRPILRANKMPEDLVYLAMIESGFHNHARSHAKAVGPWQFISATGKRYGLQIHWWIDERRDTHKSTVAAAEFLRDLYSIFQSWELAAAAYNAGEAKIARAIRRYGTKDFWALARHHFLRPETRDYVPKIIAAAIVAKNRTQFGFAPSKLKPGSGEVISGEGEIVKLEKDQGESKVPAPDNPEEALAKILTSDDYENAPTPETEVYGAVEGEQAESPKPPFVAQPSPEPEYPARAIPTPHVNRQGELVGEELMEFEIQSPADLLTIARASGLSYATVKSLNPEVLRWCTPPSVKTFRIKLPVSVKEKFLTAYNAPEFPKRARFLTYRAQRGESVQGVARRLGIRVDPLIEINRLSPGAILKKGAEILLPLPLDKSRSMAELEVRDPPERRRARRSAARSRSKRRK